MRFNKSELTTLALNPTTKFDKEGVLIFTERQEGLFRHTDVNNSRWCKLRGNLLFYLKDVSKFSSPAGVIVLENCRPVIRNNDYEFDGYVFILEFQGNVSQRIACLTIQDRLEWVKSIQLSSFTYINHQINYLKEQLSKTVMGNRIDRGVPIAVQYNEATLMNSAVTSMDSISLRINNTGTDNQQTSNVEEDVTEIPICESVLSCDNLAFGDNDRIPNPRIVCAVLRSSDNAFLWCDYAQTEVIENSVNPQFLCTICFRRSAGFTANSLLRFTVYDIREKVSLTAVPIGYAEVALGVIQDATRFRIPLKSINGECGFITIGSWAPDTDKQAPPRSTTQVFEQQTKGHRRSQSLPSKLGAKLFVPFQGGIQRVFAYPKTHTYRLHSTMGADICVRESLFESKLCFNIPLQLLSIWILREKELLQEISGMGELGGEWRQKQMDLLDKHLKLLKDFSQAKQNIQQLLKENGPSFKRSSVKTDKSLEFIPVNLHLQRMWAQNDTINRTGVLDIITVGAFTRHAAKGRCGGLIKLLQEIKDTPTKVEHGNACKVQAANDAVQAIKQLRKEIVEIMSQLLSMAKCKNPKGMMPLSNEMVIKTKILLNIWEPTLVEEAFAFVEQHRIIEEPDNTLMPMSPFRKITQQLSALNLKSPELEDFATPIVDFAQPDLWPRVKTPLQGTGRQLIRSNSFHMRPSPSSTDINTIYSLHRTVKCYNEQLKEKIAMTDITNISDEGIQTEYQSLPLNLTNDMNINEEHFDDTDNMNCNLQLIDLDEMENINAFAATSRVSKTSYNRPQSSFISTDHFSTDLSKTYNHNLNNYNTFLDTRVMSSSPSANYYRPTEEPEPLDLTQLNIEASVMCLVSKIKFLCGRCGSPAIRLRHPKTNLKRSGFTNSPAPDIVSSQSLEIENLSCNNIEIDNSNHLNLDIKPIGKSIADNGIELCVKKGNKFTDGLDLSLTTDWAAELRPSMRKLRHAMDGLLKTARLMHSVQRLQQDMKRNSINLEVMYRRDVCFSQAMTALISALMAKLWGTDITENFLKILQDLGPLVYFEGLLSLYGGEIDMWGDMCIAVEDLLGINFTLVRCNLHSNDVQSVPTPRISGTRQSIHVALPIPEHVYAILPTKETINFKVTPIFFNIGINEKATIAETLGQTREQHRSNWDNFVRLKLYYSRYRKLNLSIPETPSKHEPHMPATPTLFNLLNFMEEQLHSNVSKNVKILHLAEDACRLMSGLRFTSCKSAKDRTGMAVTLEQCRVLVQEFQLSAKNVPVVLNTIRSEGTRMDNVYKNIDKRKYAFNLPQVLSLPAMYRPPTGSYGKAET